MSYNKHNGNAIYAKYLTQYHTKWEDAKNQFDNAILIVKYVNNNLKHDCLQRSCWMAFWNINYKVEKFVHYTKSKKRINFLKLETLEA